MEHYRIGVIANTIRRFGVAVAVSATFVMALLVQSASAQTVTIESWENTLDGWQVPSPFGTQAGFTPSFVTSPAPGVTDGSAALAITGSTSSPNYSQMLISAASTNLTAALGASDSLTLDIYTPPGSFGFFLQFDFDINNADTGFQSLDGFGYPATTIGSETALTVPISAALRSTLAASTNTTQIDIQIGGGFSNGNETMVLDNLRVHEVVPEPSTFALLGLGLLGLFGMRRRAS